MRTSLVVLLAVALVPAACLATSAGIWEERVAEHKSVTLAVKDTPVGQVIDQITKEAGISYALQGEVPLDRKVTIRLNSADPTQALFLVCRAAGLEGTPSAGGWIIRVPPVVTVSGATVPVLGALQYSVIPDLFFTGGRAGAQELPQFPSHTALVSLDVKDAPLPDAVAQLAKAAKVSIRVDESVSKGIKVTARLYQTPLREVLGLLVGQANLSYTVGEAEEAGGAPVVVIVPRPYLEVSGPGIGGGGGTSFGFGSIGGGGFGDHPDATLGPVSLPVAAPQVPLTKPVMCDKCKQVLMLPQIGRSWQFCPYCGAKLPAEEQPTKKNQ